VGLSPAYLSRIENEKEPPPSEAVIEKLAEALGADKYELFGHAGKVPSEFLETFRKNPKSMASFMRRVQEAGVDVPTVDWTWDDLLAKALKLTKDTGDPTTQTWGYLFRRIDTEHMCQSWGGNWVVPDEKKCDFTKPETIEPCSSSAT
jgi:transcriptional regulator with XRE-family HTH domain